MSGIATGWVGQNGPRPDDIDRHGVEYGGRARGWRMVLLGIADAANTKGEHAHPGVDGLASFALYSPGQVRRICSELAEEGWVEVVEQGGGRGRATVFNVLMDRRETLPPRAGFDTANARVAADETRAPGAETRAPSCAPNGVPTEDPTVEISTVPEIDAFDAFWSVVLTTAPSGSRRKGSKPDVAKAYRAALRKPGVTPEVIMAGYERWNRYWAEKNQMEYEPGMAPWLRDERWNDETPVVRGRRGVESNLDAVREVREAYEVGGVAPGDLFGLGGSDG